MLAQKERVGTVSGVVCVCVVGCGGHGGELEYVGQVGDHKIRPSHHQEEEIRQASIPTTAEPVRPGLLGQAARLEVYASAADAGDAGRQQCGGVSAGGVAVCGSGSPGAEAGRQAGRQRRARRPPPPLGGYAREALCVRARGARWAENVRCNPWRMAFVAEMQSALRSLVP